MYNIGIMEFKETGSGIASFFSPPKVEECFTVKMGEQVYTFNIISCLYGTKSLLDQRKVRQLSKLCGENDIKLLVTLGKPDARAKLYGAELGDISAELREIKAIKLLGALIRLSQKKDLNLLEKRIGFTEASTDFETVDLLSEEASGIMVFEGCRMCEQDREALHLQVMQSKGISLIFTKELPKIIRSSDVLIVDEDVDLRPQEVLLKGKVILGNNAGLKDIIEVSKVLLWPEPLKSIQPCSYCIEHNDEILAVLRYCMKKTDSMEFLSLLSNIYMFDGNGKLHTMPQAT